MIGKIIGNNALNLFRYFLTLAALITDCNAHLIA